LFDAALKKPLPLLPRGVGIVTSETGAVIRDIQNVASRRHPGVPLFLYPAKVQGDGSAEDVARGILYLDEYNEADIIIIARGGGSLEDLWAFNEEIVARAIYDCSKPVISAVGHETDTSLSDFAADARAPTPSAAAEIAVPKLEALEEEIARCAARLTRGVNMRIAAMRERTRALSHRLTIRRPDRVIAENRLRVARLSEMIALCARQAFGPRRMRVNGLIERLNALDPTRVLTRGYAILTDESGRCLPDAAAVDIGQRIVVRMRDGTVGARVSDKG
jgi:exodeoxyribonuclease VII large subunit